MTGEGGAAGEGTREEQVEAQAAAAAPEAASPEATAPEADVGGQPEDATVEAAPLSDLVREAFAVYLDKSGARAEYGDHVNVDLAFLKAHGVPMVATLFRELATRLVPPDLKLDVPLAPRQPPPTDAAAPEGGPRPVSVNLDLGGILARMFTPKPPEPPKGG
jgi:hypothetical protein